jgi:hypothetical protein
MGRQHQLQWGFGVIGKVGYSAIELTEETRGDSELGGKSSPGLADTQNKSLPTLCSPSES